MTQSFIHQYVDVIVEALFAADTRRIGSEVTRLNKANGEAKGQKFFGFIHNGKRYFDPRYASQAKVLNTFQMPTLPITLHAQIKDFDLDVKRIESDKAKIRQALVPLLVGCTSLQHIRDALPDCLVHMINEIRDLKRMEPDNTIRIRDDKYAMKAYEKALPLMQAYSVSALIY